MPEAYDPHPILAQAVDAVRAGQSADLSTLDDAPVALYVTDADGLITYFNRACISFAGRTPTVGEDRWCVTWKLYTDDGQFLPHDECPMAVALKERREVRGARAVAERPDGVRLNFAPYPTPILDEDGRLLGAVNALIDITNLENAHSLRLQAQKCRRLALSVDPLTASRLGAYADELDARAIRFSSLH